MVFLSLLTPFHPFLFPRLLVLCIIRATFYPETTLVSVSPVNSNLPRYNSSSIPASELPWAFTLYNLACRLCYVLSFPSMYSRVSLFPKKIELFYARRHASLLCLTKSSVD